MLGVEKFRENKTAACKYLKYFHEAIWPQECKLGPILGCYRDRISAKNKEELTARAILHMKQALFGGSLLACH